MVKIQLEIDKCNECPFVIARRSITAYWFDSSHDYICTRNGRTIAEYIDMPGELNAVPEWCPIKVEDVAYG